MANDDTLDLATDLTMAWLANPSTRASASDVPAFLAAMHKAVSELGAPAASAVEEAPAHTAAVSIRKSLASPDYIVSMITGEKLRTLTRHIGKHGMTADQYRQRYNLPTGYPMTAPSYSAARSDMAKARGFGRKAGERRASNQPVEAAQMSASGSKSKSGRMTAVAAKKAAQAHLGSDD